MSTPSIMHDVWVAWFYGKSAPFAMPKFYEWRKSDDITLIERAPLIKVTERDYYAISEGYPELPQEILKEIEGLAYARLEKTHRELIDYCMVITDGKSAIAIYTQGGNEPLYKSALTPHHEKLAIERTTDSIPRNLDLTTEDVKDKENNDLPSYIMTGLSENYHQRMLGLTRKERAMKELMLSRVYEIHKKDSRGEALYWYTELFPDRYSDVETAQMTTDDIIANIYREILNKWSNHHVEFGNLLMKGHSVYEDVWNNLLSYTTETDAGKRNKTK